ncbi:MAG TPA: hypothetical protein VKA64_10130 [Gammaproteobacteria bacterium]|nr:hypothetical protein [Gammaproteobacteria bacterium]
MENGNQAAVGNNGSKFLDEKKKTALVMAMSGIGNAVLATVIAAVAIGLGPFGGY